MTASPAAMAHTNDFVAATDRAGPAARCCLKIVCARCAVAGLVCTIPGPKYSTCADQTPHAPGRPCDRPASGKGPSSRKGLKDRLSGAPYCAKLNELVSRRDLSPETGGGRRFRLLLSRAPRKWHCRPAHAWRRARSRPQNRPFGSAPCPARVGRQSDRAARRESPRTSRSRRRSRSC